MTSPVFHFDGDSPALRQAIAGARASFRYFLRELCWERQRIIPGWDQIAVKAAFADGAAIEHMWVGEPDFDGFEVSGVLLNQPNELGNVKQGDPVRFGLHTHLTDWLMVGVSGVFGGFSIQLMRGHMKPDERAAHDGAWGIDFGDPKTVRVPHDGPLHPMAVNMLPSLPAELKKGPALRAWKDERGFTLLHLHALAGNTNVVEVLLDHGFDPRSTTQRGATPLALARSLDWKDVEAVLTRPRA